MPIATDHDFSGQDLRGRSFRGQDLTGANFCRADLRGTDFSRAVLQHSNFRQAKAGLERRWQLTWLIGLLILMALFGFLSALAGLYLGWLLTPEMIVANTIVPGLAVLLMTTLNALIVMRQGLQSSIRTIVNTTIIIIATSILLLILIDPAKLVLVADLLSGGMLNALGIVVSFTVIYPVTFAILISITNSHPTAFLIAALGAAVGTAITRQTYPNWEAIATAGLGAGSLLCLSAYVGGQAIAGNEKYRILHQLAIALVSQTGTNFTQSDLAQANFNQARLKHANFQRSHLDHTNFYQAQGLQQACTTHTILHDPTVCHLVVTHQGCNHTYIGRNLKGANLTAADLRGADFTEADLSGALLTDAALENSNWSKAQAIGTNFHQANLTGACLEAWNIDSTSQLDAIICDYIYLRHPHQERRPSSGNFGPGDFTELFQEIIHTIDLIFRQGIDQQAFNYSLHQLQLENNGIPLTIRSLERKGNGVVVVRVDVPATADKPLLHAGFTQHYDLALQAIAAQLHNQYQAQLQAKDEQIAIYREQQALQQQQQADWREVVQLLKTQAAQTASVQLASVQLASVQTVAATVPATVTKRVILQVGAGDRHTGFAVTLQIGQESPTLQFTQGRFAPIQSLIICYEQWQTSYRACLYEESIRLDIPEQQITHVGRSDAIQACELQATTLAQQLNDWLNADCFRPIKERMLEQLQPTDAIELLIQTDHFHLQQLPWSLWEFCDRYPQAEIALGKPDYQRVPSTRSALPPINILAILGDSTGINLQTDRQLLAQLPDAAVTLLVEPSRQVLSDHLWHQSWDILFFAGHSFSQADGATGYFQINATDRLSVPELKHALNQAIKQGLRLGIFNSCDGLGLAQQFADRHIPHLIVMREPVPDRVAHVFLQHFLTGFSQGNSLYRSVRQAREQLQGLEDQFPGATWLPVLYQNPAAPTLDWAGLRGDIELRGNISELPSSELPSNELPSRITDNS
jgi:uncharacterized protein YjbI with pentapeptide repeats